MTHKANKISIVVSMILTVILLMALCALVFWLPPVVNSMIATADNVGNRALMTAGERTFVLVDAYVMVTAAFAAVVLLFFLLREVLLERVFCLRTTRLIAVISWCCFLEGFLFLLIGVFFQLAFGVAIAAYFVGLCLRVVKNVIEEATRFKIENELTI